MKFSTVLAYGAAVALTFSCLASREDAYIVNSEGDQYINTGYFVGPGTKIEIDFQLTEVVNQERLFGTYGVDGDVTRPMCECYIGSDNDGNRKLSMLCSKANGSQQGSNLYPADLERHRIVMDFSADSKQFQIWTGETMVTNKTFDPFSQATSKCPLAFFAKNYTATAFYSSKQRSYAYPAKMRVYSFKIWDYGVLVRDFAPCLKGGMAGFKDLCSGVFYSGENTRACTAGGDVLVEKDDPYIYTPRNTLAAKAGRSVYIDTGYTVKPTTRVELDFAMLTDDWATNKLYSPEPYIIGALDNNGTAQFMYLTARSAESTRGRFYYRIGLDSEKMVYNTFGIDTAYGVRRTVAMDKSSIRVITAGYTNVVTTVDEGKELSIDLATYTLKIGASYTGESRFLPMKVYGLKIYESDSLVKDYKPFLNDGVACLTNSLDSSDTLLATTYSDAKGYAIPDGGGDIVDAARGVPEAYLEFDGVAGHGIDTGYMVTKDTCIELDMDLWSSDYNTQQFFFEQRGYSSTKANCNGMWPRLYTNGKYAYSFRDYSFNGNNHGNFTTTGVSAVPNARRQFKFDGYTGEAYVKDGDTVLYSTTSMPGTRTNTTCTTRLQIGSSWSGNGNPACMRLYSFKISEAGVLQHDYIPCVKNGEAGLYDLKTYEFKPLTGGKVVGKGVSGQSGDFMISPQPAKLTHKEGENSTTLTCLAVGWRCPLR